MNFNDAQIQQFIAEAKCDEVTLWFIINCATLELGLQDRSERREVTMDAVRRLLASGEVKAGFYSPDRSGRIDLWNLDNDAVLARIEKEWDELGHEPDIADIVVFIGHEQAHFKPR